MKDPLSRAKRCIDISLFADGRGSFLYDIFSVAMCFSVFRRIEIFVSSKKFSHRIFCLKSAKISDLRKI